MLKSLFVQNYALISQLEVEFTGGLSVLTGETGGEMKNHCDILLNMPSKDTPRIQEGHALVGHIICQLVESGLFPK